jgi:AraC-like DNA-binding protein
MSNTDARLIPMSYVARWLALLETRGVTPELALAGSGMALDAVNDPNARITLEALSGILQRGAALAGDPSLGFELGLSMKPTSHGWLGYALICCNTLRDACELGMRYLGVRASPLRCHVFVEGDTAVMQFEETLPLGEARMLIIEALLGAVIRIGEFMLGHSFAHPDIEFCADYPEQPHHARFFDRVPRVRYSCPKNQARFPAAWLDRALALAEPVAAREAVAALAQELRLVTTTEDWVERTRAVLGEPGNGCPDLDAAATRLKVSSRTLRRHLQRQGSTFHELRDEVRRARAITLLANSEMPIDAVARELGYADVAGFTRAFQRWTGQSPSTYRKRR